MNEVQLILAEKRTSLAVMRTGIAVLALPLSVLSVLIATSRYYDILRVIHLLVLLGAVNLGLMALGAYLIVRAMVRMKHHDRRIHEIKLKHRAIGRLID
ncbi:MAG: hypothetical protein JXR37_37665 [Kiritimatiellae bacterium]|nr:hypothetical protein [Kiritimatiellia bacterium]